MALMAAARAMNRQKAPLHRIEAVSLRRGWFQRNATPSRPRRASLAGMAAFLFHVVATRPLPPLPQPRRSAAADATIFSASRQAAAPRKRKLDAEGAAVAAARARVERGSDDERSEDVDAAEAKRGVAVAAFGAGGRGARRKVELTYGVAGGRRRAPRPKESTLSAAALAELEVRQPHSSHPPFATLTTPSPTPLVCHRTQPSHVSTPRTLRFIFLSAYAVRRSSSSVLRPPPPAHEWSIGGWERFGVARNSPAVG